MFKVVPVGKVAMFPYHIPTVQDPLVAVERLNEEDRAA